jgi:dUTP pyrophosphatase
MPVKIKFKKLHPDAKIPTKATSGSAGFDVYGVRTFMLGNRIHVFTGLAVAFPKDWMLQAHGRSGLSARCGISLANNVGIIDSDYRGEIVLLFDVNPGMDGLHVDHTVHMTRAFDELAPGKRVAQLMLVPVPLVEWEEVEDLDETSRGTGGFGSTGTN